MSAPFAHSDTTSLIPSIGMTFRQAGDRVRELIDLTDSSAESDPDEVFGEDEWTKERFRIEKALFAAPCATVADILVKLERMADEVVGVHAIGLEAEQTAQLRADLQHLTAQSGEHVTDPALAAYLEWVAVANAINRDFAIWQGMADDNPERDAVNKAICEAEHRCAALEEVMRDAAAASPAGILAKLAYFTHMTANCIHEVDVRFWQSIVADIARLGIVPLEADVAAFGEGRYFGAVHRAAMSDDGIDPPGRSITLPSSLWEPTVEQAGIIYRLPVGVAELMVAEERQIHHVNADKAAANPDGAKALNDRALMAFRRLPDERIRWLEFGVTGWHLHAASLRFAQENDLLGEYRDRLIEQLRGVEGMRAGMRAGGRASE